MKTKHAFFRIKQFKKITLNKKGKKQNYILNTALESQNDGMTKCKLKYTKEILQQMLNLEKLIYNLLTYWNWK
ncbi:unnamed protein product [Paramecium sonneborni]|uniref:Uncharacterized protein n=1 Tax=Paramecium sonneborni TaxID=65129 RepID=A0A8S1RCI7_9CILI|nr:unnamed protein product [Paramecium sonneborni]